MKTPYEIITTLAGEPMTYKGEKMPWVDGPGIHAVGMWIGEHTRSKYILSFSGYRQYTDAGDGLRLDGLEAGAKALPMVEADWYGFVESRSDDVLVYINRRKLVEELNEAVAQRLATGEVLKRERLSDGTTKIWVPWDNWAAFTPNAPAEDEPTAEDEPAAQRAPRPGVDRDMFLLLRDNPALKRLPLDLLVRVYREHCQNPQTDGRYILKIAKANGYIGS